MSLAKLKHWRQAATIIMAAKSGKTTMEAGHGYTNKLLSKGFNDYKILMLKRSSKSKFMPNAYVFPGGAVSESDVSPTWLELFKKAGCGDVNIDFNMYIGPRPPMIRTKHNSTVTNDVAFRICAIREMFEESGVLLALDFQTACNRINNYRDEENTDHVNLMEKTAFTSQNVNSNDLLKWRDRVNQDDKEFLVMCQELSVVPNIWALNEWNNWLTPTDMMKAGHAGRRFDTLFYVVCVEEMPHFVFDNKEVVSAEWSQPLDVLQRYYEKELWIAPPQIYELSRLCHFPFLNELFSFASHREKHGCQCWLPVRFNCKDGLLSVLPGDDLYPVEPNYEGHSLETPFLDMTMAESLEKSKHQNRFEINDRFNIVVRVSEPQAVFHVSPVGPEFVKDQKSSLNKL